MTEHTAATHLQALCCVVCRFGEMQAGARCRTTKCLTLEACEMIAVSASLVLRVSLVSLCLVHIN